MTAGVVSKPTESHTLLWVPRFWPAVGGTEFHSHRLAVQLAEEGPVTVVTHCTQTETAKQPLARLAAEAQAHLRRSGRLTIVTLAPELKYRRALMALGQRHDNSLLTRRTYQWLFEQAFREGAAHAVAHADRVHCIYNGLTESARLAADTAERFKVPFVFTPNVLDTTPVGSAWASKSFLRLYDRAEHLIALTEHEAEWLVARGADPQRLSVVPYGPVLSSEPLDDAEQERGLLHQPFILFLARLVPEKGYRTLIEAFVKLAASDGETRLVLAGPADDAVRELICRTNRQWDCERIHLIRDVSQPMKTALLRHARVLCVPSTRESLGGVYIEAMASGTAVVALDRPVSRCVIDHGRDGLLVTNSVEAIAAALRGLINDPERARAMGEAGRAKVAERYAWSVVRDGVQGVYAAAATASKALARAA